MPLMRRRPVLRAAAVGGAAYQTGKRRTEAQQREADQEARLAGLEQQGYPQPPQAAAPPPPQAAAPPPQAAGGSADTIAQLQQLAALRDQGVLTDEEFAQQKAKLLGT